MKTKIILISIALISVILIIIGLKIYIDNPSSNKSEKEETTNISSQSSEKSSSMITSSTQKETTTSKVEKETTKVKSTKKSTTSKISKKSKSTTTKKTSTKKDEEKPWERFGVTEDEYYNKPMFSWEKVDFSVEKYGSEKAARNACLEYGDKYQPYLDGKVAYNCSSVTSLSGRYLGEHFYTEETR